MGAQVCWPINTLIQPGSNYSLELQAQTGVLQALAWDVANSSLQLSTNASFRSINPIVAIVTSSLPSSAYQCAFFLQNLPRCVDIILVSFRLMQPERCMMT